LATATKQTTERRPLLGGRFFISMDIRPLLGNGSVNNFPQHRISMQQRNGVSTWSCWDVIRRKIEARIVCYAHCDQTGKVIHK
jgi:hypothetical protein